METDFLSSWNKILLFRDFCSVCGNRELQFLKYNLIPASGNWFFLARGNLFFLFWDSPATANFIFPSSGNVFLNAFRLVERDFLATHLLSIFQTFMLVFFLSSGNVFLKRILHSGQWKTFCFNISNIPSIGSSFSISWKYILNESFITASGNGFSV